MHFVAQLVKFRNNDAQNLYLCTVLRRFYISLLLTLCALSVEAQTTRVSGRVIDAITGHPIAFAAVSLPGTVAGTMTDAEGLYSFESRDTVTLIEASQLGYRAQKRRLRLGIENGIDFVLAPETQHIEEIVVLPGDNPSHPILDSVISRRPLNDPNYYDTYKSRTYTKLQLDIANIKEFRSKRLQRDFGFIFDYVDTSAITGKAYLPVLISETSADLYHRHNPSLRREVIEASRTSGVENNSIFAQFMGGMHADVNFYDNYIEFFNVRFASPLSTTGKSFYNYFLVDSTHIEGRKTYKIRFHPKRLATPVLDGEVNIDSATYALRSASVMMPKGVNVNWINHLNIYSENKMLDSTRWFKLADRLSAEVSLTDADSTKLTSFIASREITYTDVEIGKPLPEHIERMTSSVEIIPSNLETPDEEYWTDVRPRELTLQEKNIYSMVERIKEVPLFRNIITIVNAMVGGYYNTKYIGFGPYYKVISFNDLEGARAQMGLRTTQNVSKRIRLTGHLAYGFRDEDVKGGLIVELPFSQRLTRELTITARHDVMQLGASSHAFSESNILSSIFSRGNERLSMVDRVEVNYEHDWRSSFTNFVGARWQRIHSNGYVPMVASDGSLVDYIDDKSVMLGLRLSGGESIVRTAFDKEYITSPKPIFTLDVTAGEASYNDFSEPYLRLEGALSWKMKVPPIGYSRFLLRGGKIFGEVPYPMLKLHEGNGTYFYDPYDFSCMNFYEFSSDVWASLLFEHHFNGYLLGRLPLIKKLRLREVVTCKTVWGTLSDRNNGSAEAIAAGSPARMLFPEGMSSVNDPYVELGVGVENIFKMLRVDCIWRVTHREPVATKDFDNFSINVSLQVAF